MTAWPSCWLSRNRNGRLYAAKVYPGDLGTKGGILTDEFARALREDGSVIDGLYAAGNCSASVMGRTYPAPGSTLGPATVFGYIGGRHMAGRAQAWDGLIRAGRHACWNRRSAPRMDSV